MMYGWSDTMVFDRFIGLFSSSWSRRCSTRSAASSAGSVFLRCGRCWCSRPFSIWWRFGPWRSLIGRNRKTLSDPLLERVLIRPPFFIAAGRPEAGWPRSRRRAGRQDVKLDDRQCRIADIQGSPDRSHIAADLLAAGLLVTDQHRFGGLLKKWPSVRTAIFKLTPKRHLFPEFSMLLAIRLNKQTRPPGKIRTGV